LSNPYEDLTVQLKITVIQQKQCVRHKANRELHGFCTTMIFTL